LLSSVPSVAFYFALWRLNSAPHFGDRFKLWAWSAAATKALLGLWVWMQMIVYWRPGISPGPASIAVSIVQDVVFVLLLVSATRACDSEDGSSFNASPQLDLIAKVMLAAGVAGWLLFVISPLASAGSVAASLRQLPPLSSSVGPLLRGTLSLLSGLALPLIVYLSGVKKCH